ncbi:hypothetical protein EAX61_14995 [Dokdonia sinensis]|uniref:Uncharacterized protein n=1 Tax=Dokdonia sinensis TaxID=2479847 RepID=A0A3M0FUA0_9FLAO|nr:hypothetical protein [Dokdonia sinensis]RMB56264.1 hypothetical protein EAX61_14995 [Dokdonia sinensis]
MESSKYLEDIASIKNMMHKSSRFMSLSGLSGILAGVYALIAFVVAYRVIAFQTIPGLPSESNSTQELYIRELYQLFLADHDGLATKLLLIGLVTLILALVTGIIFTIKKAKKHDEKIWDTSSRRLIYNFAIPLFTGGAFCIVLIQYGLIGLIAPATLIFYGLALVNASKFTLGDIKYLGIANVIIGLIATQFIGYGLYFWALGFGVFHIIYGTIMYRKYDKV